MWGRCKTDVGSYAGYHISLCLASFYQIKASMLFWYKQYENGSWNTIPQVLDPTAVLEMLGLPLHLTDQGRRHGLCSFQYSRCQTNHSASQPLDGSVQRKMPTSFRQVMHSLMWLFQIRHAKGCPGVISRYKLPNPKPSSMYLAIPMPFVMIKKQRNTGTPYRIKAF